MARKRMTKKPAVEPQVTPPSTTPRDGPTDVSRMVAHPVESYQFVGWLRNPEAVRPDHLWLMLTLKEAAHPAILCIKTREEAEEFLCALRKSIDAVFPPPGEPPHGGDQVL